ncbi:YiiX/YebB-like N1pC/P60 family cysteine hydrolase [Marinobacter sp. M1N3S26]|uniref:YiiX/YebB-like N1pC/P60 family cysteine hydrolase n=1 Tax=Marinobacter sp. M1N3S26 TaxID=3382299 RepID=UPI00387AD8E1
MFNWISRALARYLSKPVADFSISTSTWEALQATIQPGDVLLVEGDTRVSVAIKYLTQSTWSHAALYLGEAAGLGYNENGEANTMVEADLEAGIRAISLSFYRHRHTRICRPVDLGGEALEALALYSRERLGHQYDLKNIVDLARYLLPTPPVPVRYRRRMLALGSGDPTRAICSSFIAQGFQSIHYPILPEVIAMPSDDPKCRECEREFYRIRHHSLFVPRDFDASPYFEIIKPTIAQGFDYRALEWLRC